jgi:hypothetical protein
MVLVGVNGVIEFEKQKGKNQDSNGTNQPLILWQNINMNNRY